MRRSLARLPSCTVPIGGVAGRHSAFFTSSSGGGGRGRGRGFPNEFSIVPPRPGSTDESRSTEQPQPPLGHGRGKPLPSFSAFVNPPPPASAGRGRGSGSTPPRPLSKPTYQFTAPAPPPPPPPSHSDKPEEPNLPSSIFNLLSGAGRGKPVKSPEASMDKPKRQENRHIRSPRLRETSDAGATPLPQPQRLSRDEAIKKAVGILSRGDEQDGSAGGRGSGRGGFRGRGGRGRGMTGQRGRGGRGGGGRGEEHDDDYASGLYLGDDADGEKLAKRLGLETMNNLVEGFEEMSSTVLPSPADDLYLDALHTNLMIECEPEYLMGEFDQNPDIDEKPPIPLRDALEKMKPFLMAYEGIQSQQEWEEVVEDTMERVPLIKELVDHYSGPDRVTAKQQQEELERVAKTLPESSPASVKRFTDRAVLSLQSNPGWGFDKKCQFMDKLVWEVSQQYK